jgi:TM2 domain-containing membrane protein YozV
MRKALKAPVLSALVIGLGQLIVGHRAKGALLIAGMSIWFLITLATTAWKVTSAMGAVADGPPVDDKWLALGRQIQADGAAWAYILIGIFLAMWLFSVIDAAIGGARADRAPDPGNGEDN